MKDNVFSQSGFFPHLSLPYLFFSVSPHLKVLITQLYARYVSSREIKLPFSFHSRFFQLSFFSFFTCLGFDASSFFCARCCWRTSSAYSLFLCRRKAHSISRSVTCQRRRFSRGTFRFLTSLITLSTEIFDNCNSWGKIRKKKIWLETNRKLKRKLGREKNGDFFNASHHSVHRNIWQLQKLKREEGERAKKRRKEKIPFLSSHFSDLFRNFFMEYFPYLLQAHQVLDQRWHFRDIALVQSFSQFSNFQQKTFFVDFGAFGLAA